MKIHHNLHSRGFALVATVSMMVLLTLVAIAMLSLSTIEQRSSGGGSNEADRMARANARMALMIALGELQKAAGPDQRVPWSKLLLQRSAESARTRYRKYLQREVVAKVPDVPYRQTALKKACDVQHGPTTALLGGGRYSTERALTRPRPHARLRRRWRWPRGQCG